MKVETAKLSLVERTKKSIKAELGSGRYKIGEPLPTHREWAARFRVSTFTVLRALNELKAEDIIESNEGSYTFLRKLPSSPNLTLEHTAPSESVTITTWVSGQHDLRKIRQAIARKRFRDVCASRLARIRVEEELMDCDPVALQSRLFESVMASPSPTFARSTQTYLPFLLENASLTPIDSFVTSDYLSRLKPRYAGVCKQGGKSWLLPNHVTYSFLLYDKAALSKAGLNPHQPPRDWEEFANACRLLSKTHQRKNSFVVAGSESLFWWLMHLVYQSADGLEGDVAPGVGWSDPKVKTAVAFFLKLIRDDQTLGVEPDDVSVLTRRCLDGEIPFLFGGGTANQIAELGEGERFGVMPLPTGPDGKTVSLLNCGGWFINGRATLAQQQAALRYVVEWERWLHLGNGAEQMRRLGIVPSLHSLFHAADQDLFWIRDAPLDWKRAFGLLEEHSYIEPPFADWKRVAFSEPLLRFLNANTTCSEEDVVRFLRLEERMDGFAGGGFGSPSLEIHKEIEQ